MVEISLPAPSMVPITLLLTRHSILTVLVLHYALMFIPFFSFIDGFLSESGAEVIILDVDSHRYLSSSWLSFFFL